MPAVTKTPNEKWLLCQNLDNQITTYAASDRFKLNRRKVFKGHVVAGYGSEHQPSARLLPRTDGPRTPRFSSGTRASQASRPTVTLS